MKLLVVGAGEMGIWFARTAADGLAEPVDVAFTDTDDEAARTAAADVDGRVVPSTTDERFDVVCLAVPIPAVETAVESWADRADAAVVDVTGVMEPVVDAVGSVAPDVERVSFHPLFAPGGGPGNVAVVADSPGPVTDGIRAALAAAGNHCFETTAADHDEAMETVQARVHAAVLAFGLAAADVPDEFQTPVSAAMFDLLDHVTGNEPRVYADVQAAFDGASDVADAARAVADADAGTFAEYYRQAARDRSAARTDDVPAGEDDDEADVDESTGRR